jgi:hypothetical protein
VNKFNCEESQLTRILKISLTFLVGGFLHGLLFALLISRPGLTTFWFHKADKFLVPRLSYWVCFGATLISGLIFSLAASHARFRLWASRPTRVSRLLNASLLIALAAPMLYLVTPTMQTLVSHNWFLLSPLIFLVLLSVALCIYAGDFSRLPVAIGLIAAAALIGFSLVYAAVNLTANVSEWYDFIQWPIVESALVTGCGIWLAINERQSSAGNT